ncbi:unnamed protein product [Moneuplotes crassus]|uniref:Uncharacterized protein n=1 Tax=Euplotes crassus TaxID=5936 RepID=A0AAD1U3K4_EUPCR|nr:unnamed protein product [Moneuplotes crassus]
MSEISLETHKFGIKEEQEEWVTEIQEFSDKMHSQSMYSIDDFINMKIKRALDGFTPSKNTIQMLKPSFISREEHKVFQKQSEIIRVRMDTVESSQNHVLEDLTDMKKAITNKADHEEVENQLKQIADYIKKVDKSLSSYTLNKDHDITQRMLQRLEESLDKLSKKTYSDDEVDAKFKSIYKKMKQTYTTLDSFEAQNDRLLLKINMLQREIIKNTKGLGVVDETFKTLREEFSNKIKKKCEIDDLIKLRAIVVPTIDDFKAKIKAFTKDNNDCKDIVQRFDEVITLKASKISLHKVEESLQRKVQEDSYQEDQQIIFEDFSKLQAQMQNLGNKIDDFNTHVQNKVQEYGRKEVNKIRAEINQNKLGGGKIDLDDIKSMVEDKINKEELMTLLNFKANKEDSKNNQKALEMLHKQSKHLVVLIIELIKQASTKFTNSEETRNAKESKLSSILKVALNIAKWMNSFDLYTPDGPEAFECPPELSNFDLSVKKSFTSLKSSRLKLPVFPKIRNLTLESLSVPRKEASASPAFANPGSHTSLKLSNSKLTRNYRANLSIEPDLNGMIMEFKTQPSKSRRANMKVCDYYT